MRRQLASLLLILAAAGCAHTPPGIAEFSSTGSPRPTAGSEELGGPSMLEKSSNHHAPGTPPGGSAAPAAAAAPAESVLRRLQPRAIPASAPAPVRLARAKRSHDYALAPPPAPEQSSGAAAPPKPDESRPAATDHAQYPVGNAAYHVPKAMVQDQASTVALWIDRRVSVDELQTAMARQLKINAEHIKTRLGKTPGTGDDVMAGDVMGLPGIRIGDKMFAQLHGGEDFDIDPKEPVSGDLQQNERVMWNWRVKPKRHSEEGLLLLIEVWVDPGPGRGTIPSIEERVIVNAPEASLADRLKAIQEFLDSIDQIYKALAGLSLLGGLAVSVKKLLRRLRRKQVGRQIQASATPE